MMNFLLSYVNLCLDVTVSEAYLPTLMVLNIANFPALPAPPPQIPLILLYFSYRAYSFITHCLLTF